MLRELWAKLRGVDRWPEVKATVRSVLQYEDPPYRHYDSAIKLADVTFAFTNGLGEHQYGCITVAYTSDLYDAKENDTFLIRIDPKDQDQYYSPEATSSRL